jgi:hypothetical protein
VCIFDNHIENTHGCLKYRRDEEKKKREQKYERMNEQKERKKKKKQEGKSPRFHNENDITTRK